MDKFRQTFTKTIPTEVREVTLGEIEEIMSSGLKNDKGEAIEVVVNDEQKKLIKDSIEKEQDKNNIVAFIVKTADKYIMLHKSAAASMYNLSNIMAPMFFFDVLKFLSTGNYVAFKVDWNPELKDKGYPDKWVDLWINEEQHIAPTLILRDYDGMYKPGYVPTQEEMLGTFSDNNFNGEWVIVSKELLKVMLESKTKESECESKEKTNDRTQK